MYYNSDIQYITKYTNVFYVKLVAFHKYYLIHLLGKRHFNVI